MTTLPRPYPSHARPAAGSVLGALQAGLCAPVVQLELWAERRQQRRALLGMGDHMLKDVGLSRVDAAAESGKPFWHG